MCTPRTHAVISFIYGISHGTSWQLYTVHTPKDGNVLKRETTETTWAIDVDHLCCILSWRASCTKHSGRGSRWLPYIHGRHHLANGAPKIKRMSVAQPLGQSQTGPSPPQKPTPSGQISFNLVLSLRLLRGPAANAQSIGRTILRLHPLHSSSLPYIPSRTTYDLPWQAMSIYLCTVQVCTYAYRRGGCAAWEVWRVIMAQAALAGRSWRWSWWAIQGFSGSSSPPFLRQRLQPCLDGSSCRERARRSLGCQHPFRCLPSSCVYVYVPLVLLCQVRLRASSLLGLHSAVSINLSQAESVSSTIASQCAPLSPQALYSEPGHGSCRPGGQACFGRPPISARTHCVSRGGAHACRTPLPKEEKLRSIHADRRMQIQRTPSHRSQ